MRFTIDDIAPMARGAAVLGGGGAGEPFVAEVMLGEVLRENESIEIIGLDELDDDAEVAPFALMGSPHALSEKLLGTVEPSILFTDNTLRSRTPSAVMPYEMAGLNALYPLAAAGLLGVPCVDGDFVGRGVPSLDLTTLELDGAQPDSYLLCDPNRRTVTIQKSGGLSVERLVRPVVETMGWLVVVSTSSLSTAFCRAHALCGSVTRCLELGRAFGRLPALDESEAATVLARCGGAVIGSGVITDRLSFADGFGPRSSLAVESDDPVEAPLRVELRNEFHLAVRAGEILAAAPDILVVVDRVGWRPLSAEDATPGRDVHVIALPADDRWRSERGLRLAGPRALGYGLDYVEFSIAAHGGAPR
ncbi:DUF917 domain-containing protein [Streptomyces samsunensis]|uniref:DUF917 domain-containing protein n=1 Tax=Streptomyces malaysiensis TaxID=92644 RepID=UPI001582B7E6|nr:DUF917 domain-containing protein [Streptomyces samsunensis]NUH40157.1 DUF917 domain-containing protein [Streptomyces samsunensis]